MAKTIKQIADELGVSKTAVRKEIENQGLRTSLRKIGNQFAIDENAEKRIKQGFSKRKSETKSQTKTETSSRTANHEVSDFEDTLLEQLKIKDKQIETQNELIKNLQKLLDQEQQLHARTQEKLTLLETKTEEKTTDEPVVEQTKKWWKIWK